ncbi:ATP-NAD kinase [Saitoella complicata NRRL Y-17804]|uniref:ATP-NAD kinase n=1 Tax=Saitoella complicata (strain BCRC 22490 / CBS 7301 / JCM 7358 / NBRC 10748 / NRRL Y-17804) TaxID=698492 RepID=UPI0008672AA2|nr:ATP-NAD kinase [Saitoella complicata NRRL Y-17804]ODQ51591.1 ATP-NAD kinase [Saitoella complicata NRRL Y-17804]
MRRTLALFQQALKSSSSLPERTRPLLEHLTPPRRPLKGTGTNTVSQALKWATPPRNVLLVNKDDDRVRNSLVTLAHANRHLHDTYPGVNILLEPSASETLRQALPYAYTFENISDLHRTCDAVITLGGDGTILHAASLFSTTKVPPILSFSLGTLGFLLPFNFRDFREAWEDMYHGRARVLRRMRIGCRAFTSTGIPITRGVFGEGGAGMIQQAMNEVNLHRGREPHLTLLEIYADNKFVTEAVADGLIVATPTGSTAYNLSAGGPIVHPGVDALMLTPICPRSLSFRPMIFPTSTRLQLRLSEKSRGAAEVSMDGRMACVLNQGEYLEIGVGDGLGIAHKEGEESEDRGGILCVGRGEDDGWVQDVNELLRWNQSFQGRTLAHGNGE